jgi:eukaryotic-like serine/threonine-protein kinase
LADLAPPRMRLLRFGAFELDVRAGELRKHGIRIKLREQPVQILLMLLEHPGEVVLREEIQLRLWPNNTIVEFDHSINAAIKKLRDALGESADEPRYVETVARRGYRFLGEVEKIGEPQAELQPVVPPVAAPSDSLAGQVISHYRILERLGAGGMGVVYRAEDLKLRRQVALKVLPSPVGELPQSVLQRFEREARAASALNHPHICTVHGFEDLGGQPAIVMELVEGSTLVELLKQGSLPMESVLRYGAQIADALAAAHAQGIVHRDLKPGNIMIAKAGVKVLDFGLARIEHRATDEEHTQTMTAEGAILGTVQYMSPEQAQGKEADARSDIFSFGLVLYEMITGKRAFEGSNPASIMAAILEREAPALKPEELNRVVRACLAKDPSDRFQTARDVKRAIEWIVSADGEPPRQDPSKSGGARRRWLGWSVAAALAVGLAPLAFLHFREQPPTSAAPVRFQISPPQDTKLGQVLNVSPDGRKLAFITGGRLWVHLLESGESHDLTAAEGSPFWSPDSRFIGYRLQYQFKKIDATGGPAQTVAQMHSFLWAGGAWNRDDVIVFGERSLGLFRVPASGGVPVQITALDPARHETQHYGPSFLPDGRHFVYLRDSSDQATRAIYLGSVDAKPEQQSSKPLVTSSWQPVYTPSTDPGTGYLLFMREGALMAQAFDNRRMELKGQAAQIAEQVTDNGAGGGGWGAFSSSANGVLVFQRSATLDRRPRLTWYDREGKVLGTVGEPGYYADLALSPDGKRLAVAVERGRGAMADDSSIWLLDLARGGASTRFSFGSSKDRLPVWSPDGSRIIFSSNREGPINLYQKRADGEKDEGLLLKSSENKYPMSWSRDGRFLLYTVANPETKNDIWVLPLDGPKKPVPFLITKFNESQAHFSPDGHWVAYNSDESGQMEVYVRSFSMNPAGTVAEVGGKWQISNGYGSQPRWRGDGRELFYLSNPVGGVTAGVTAVEIATNPVFQPGKSQVLGLAALGRLGQWTPTADGSRFLGAVPSSGSEPYTVVLNWQAGLKK